MSKIVHLAEEMLEGKVQGRIVIDVNS